MLACETGVFITSFTLVTLYHRGHEWLYNRRMIEIQRCTDKEQWDDFVLEHDGHPLQLWGWGQVKASHGWIAERLCVFDEENQVAAAQVLIRRLPFPFRSIAYIPRGIVGDDRYTAESLDKIAALIKRDYQSVAIKIEPNSPEFSPPEGWRHVQSTILAPETILLDLRKTESELLSVMAKKTRQYIRKSAAEGLVIRRVRTDDDIAECLHLYQQTSERAGFNLHNHQYYLDVLAQMGDHSPVFAAYLDGKPVAFLWLAISADVAYELYGGMNEDGQQLRANYALKWYAIRKMKEWDLSWYDFGGLVEGGVSNFKQNWTDEATVFPGAFDKPLSPFYGAWEVLLPRAKVIAQKLRRK